MLFRSASADNSDSKVQVSIDITWDSLEFTYTDRQWDPETHSYKGGGWSDSGGNFTLTNTGNVGVMADFSYKQAEGMDEIKGYFSSSELIVPISESKNCVGLSIILDTIIKKFDRRKPFEGTHRTVVCST